LTDDARRAARALYEGAAGGNAVVVQRLLKERGMAVGVRTIERAIYSSEPSAHDRSDQDLRGDRRIRRPHHL
jgi:hypothetical protein